MGLLSTIFLGAAAAASVAHTTYSIIQAEKQREEAEKFLKEQKEQQEKLLADAKAQQERQEKQEQAIAQQARQTMALRQERMQRPGFGAGRASTLLTSPLGLSGAAPAPGAAPKKTLLGE
jgi:Tfp pilus assembly protein PilE